MNAIMKIFLSMSFSGGLLILALLLGNRFWKDKISRQWQYYIWLVVILRLLLPVGPEVSLLGRAYQAVDHAIAQAPSLPQQQSLRNIPEGSVAPAVGTKPDRGDADSPAEDAMPATLPQDMGALLTDHIWLVWLVGALGLLIRKITIYQSFIQYVKAGSAPVSDMGILDRLSMAAEQVDINKPIELCVNPLVSSPLLIGFFHPCIVLPSEDISEKDFRYIVLHELTHFKRQDMFYKWLVQITVCLHWFNPLVHLMGREITKACEFSCDEAVLVEMGCDNARDYGKTLLDAMAAVGRYKENLGAVTLNENKRLLKERLDAIMRFKTRSKAAKILTAILTLCVVLGASYIGVYTISAAADAPKPTDMGKSTQLQSEGLPESDGSPAYNAAMRDYDISSAGRNAADRAVGAVPATGKWVLSYDDSAHSRETEDENILSQIEGYYNDDSLPLFQIAFSRLDEEDRSKWLDRIYTDDRIAFWGAAVDLLDEDCALIQRYAEKTFVNDDVAYFSALARNMGEDTLEAWLDRALEDGSWAFQSMLFDALDREDEFGELEEKREKEWEEARTAEYQAAGITIDGKAYYYQGQLVNIFLDHRPDKSFYTLDMNPKGTVNIQIVRNDDNEIADVAYMTEEEVTELFGDMSEPDDEADVEIIPVDIKTIAAGETIFLGEYTLSEGDKIYYEIFADTGNGMTVYFAKDEKPNTFYWAAHNMRQPGETLKCTADFTVGPPTTEPGTYKLFLQAPAGDLGTVKGSISIIAANAS